MSVITNCNTGVHRHMLITEAQMEPVGGDSSARTVHRKKKNTQIECPY